MTGIGTHTVEINHTGVEGTDCDHFTFENVTPGEAKRRAVDAVPLEETIHRVGVWHGEQDDRPEKGHESGILDSASD